jgi:hypothetical protein
MVPAPPFAYLHHPALRWQSLFGATRRFVRKFVQNAFSRDIFATDSQQAAQFLMISLRRFCNTRRQNRPRQRNEQISAELAALLGRGFATLFGHRRLFNVQ